MSGTRRIRRAARHLCEATAIIVAALQGPATSLVGDAKRKGKSQGRDPAIDPRLQQHGEGEDNETT
jgi:hypothetical protein